MNARHLDRTAGLLLSHIASNLVGPDRPRPRSRSRHTRNPAPPRAPAKQTRQNSYVMKARGPKGQRPGGRRPGRTGPKRRTTEAVAPRRRGQRLALRRIRFRPPWRMSGRTAIIAVVLSALALSYAYPLRTYLEQQAEINELTQEQSEQRERIAELKAERQKWEDPEYIKGQARERLMLVEPGEELVIIIDDPEGAARDAGKTPKKAPKDPWYSELRDSFTESDQIGQN